MKLRIRIWQKRFWLWAYTTVERRSRPYRPLVFEQRVAEPTAPQGHATVASTSKGRVVVHVPRQTRVR